MTEWIRQTVDKRGPDACVVASFTRTAAQELVGRDLKLTPGHVGTLHSLCYHALGRPQIAELKVSEFNDAFPGYNLPTRKTGVEEDCVVADSQDEDRLASLSLLRNACKPKSVWPASDVAFERDWSDWKTQCGYVDFTDLIESYTEEIRTPPFDVRIAFVDEVQDCTPLQMRLIRGWGEYLDYFVLALDDDQAIYSFTGTKIESILHPDIPADQKRILTQSYRVPLAIQQAAESLIKTIKVREPKEYKPRAAIGHVGICPGTMKRPQAVIDEVQEWTSRGHSAMILAPCSYQLQATIHELRERNVPFHNPFRKAEGRWNPLRTGKGSTSERLLAYVHPEGAEVGGVQVWTPKQLALWSELVQAASVFRRGVKARAKDLSEREPSEKEYLEWLLSAFKDDVVFEGALSLSPEWLKRHVAAEYAKRLEYPVALFSAHGERCFRDKPQVVVGTIHSVKGGQADGVWIVPDLSISGYSQYQDKEHVDDYARLFYVALTRAKEKARVCLPATPFHYAPVLHAASQKVVY